MPTYRLNKYIHPFFRMELHMFRHLVYGLGESTLEFRIPLQHAYQFQSDSEQITHEPTLPNLYFFRRHVPFFEYLVDTDVVNRHRYINRM